MNTKEMARRGAEDAARGEADPFFYQHYYHYRKSFNRVRRQNQPQIWVIPTTIASIALIVVVFLIVGVVRSTLTPASTKANEKAAVLAPTATPVPIFLTPTVEPQRQAAMMEALSTSSEARVSNLAGKVLRGRAEPSLKAAVVASFTEGDVVQITDGPLEADGLRWWKIQGPSGSGWSAEQSPNGDLWLTPAP